MLQWHPSEATALVVMAALGYRGRVEIRDRGLPVDLTEDTSASWRLGLAAGSASTSVATRIAATASLAAREMAFEELYQINEIDYDRKKAANSTEIPHARDDAAHFLHVSVSTWQPMGHAAPVPRSNWDTSGGLRQGASDSDSMRWPANPRRSPPAHSVKVVAAVHEQRAGFCDRPLRGLRLITRTDSRTVSVVDRGP